MTRTIAVLGAAALVALSVTPALAQTWGPGGMHGFGPQVGAQPGGPALPLDQAVTRARQYLAGYRNPDLVPVEIIEFANVFYVTIREKASGKGAFALLVSRVNGNVAPEMGPPMMWNTKYSGVAAGVGPHGHGMMGGGMAGYDPGNAGPGWGPGMMGPGAGPRQGFGPQRGAQPAPGAPGAGARPTAPTLDEAKARAALVAWAAQAFPGATIGRGVEFPGFFTYRLVRDGRTFALASVNAYGGQVWYAWQYGTVVREQAVQ